MVADLTPLSAYPAVQPDDASLDGKVIRADGGNALEIMGQATAGAGKLYLLRHHGGGVWHPVDLDANDTKSLSLDSTKPLGAIAGHFSGTWLTGDLSPAWYAVLHVGTTTFSGGKLTASTRRL